VVQRFTPVEWLKAVRATQRLIVEPADSIGDHEAEQAIVVVVHRKSYQSRSQFDSASQTKR